VRHARVAARRAETSAAVKSRPRAGNNESRAIRLLCLAQFGMRGKTRRIEPMDDEADHRSDRER